MMDATMSGTDQALLVIDLQAGAFDGVACDAMVDGARLLRNSAALIAAARAAGVPVVHVQHCEDDGVFVPGTPRWELHPAVAPQGDEARVSKRAMNAFEATGLHAVLRQAGVRRVLVCGLQSECCVTHTTQGALALGYGVTLAGDAHGTWPDKGLSAEEIIVRQNAALVAQGAQVLGTAEIVAQLARQNR